MIPEIVGIVSALGLTWLVGSWIWSRIKLRKYKKMLSTITREEVLKLAETIPYTIEQAQDGTIPPILAAYDQILQEKRKEWGF